LPGIDLVPDDNVQHRAVDLSTPHKRQWARNDEYSASVISPEAKANSACL
jgi:hypothetical protein